MTEENGQEGIIDAVQNHSNTHTQPIASSFTTLKEAKAYQQFHPQKWAKFDAGIRVKFDKNRAIFPDIKQLEDIAEQEGNRRINKFALEIADPTADLEEYKAAFQEFYQQIANQELPSETARKIILIAHKDGVADQAAPFEGDLLRVRAIIRAREQFRTILDISEKTLREIAELADLYQKRYEEMHSDNDPQKEED